MRDDTDGGRRLAATLLASDTLAREMGGCGLTPALRKVLEGSLGFPARSSGPCSAAVPAAPDVVRLRAGGVSA